MMIVIIAALIACCAIQPGSAADYTTPDQYTSYWDYGTNSWDYGTNSWDDSSFMDYFTSLLASSYKNPGKGGNGAEKKDDDIAEPSVTPVPKPTSTPVPKPTSTPVPKPEPPREDDTPEPEPTAIPTATPTITPAPEITPRPVAMGGYALPTGTVPYPSECLVIDRTAWLESGDNTSHGSLAENNTKTDNTTTVNTTTVNTTTDNSTTVNTTTDNTMNGNTTMAVPFSVTPNTPSGEVDMPSWRPGTGPGSTTSPGIPADILLILLVVACMSYIGFVAYSIIRKG